MWRLANAITAACVTVGLLAPTVAAQAPTATLAGVVTAPDGSRLPGATLLLLGEDGLVASRAISTGAGLFRIGDLPPGRYVLRTTLDGFEAAEVPGIVLASHQTVTVTVRLEVAIIQETVRVVGEGPRDTIELVEINESFARDVGEALTAIPGMTKLRKGALANDVVLRGFQGKDVTVLIDGQRIDGACPGHMDPPAFHVDFAEVRRIEVSKGPFDVRNQGGLAGIVSVVTERPRQGWRGNSNLRLGSSGALAASATTSIGRERWTLLGGASARRADPYRDGADASLLAQANYRAAVIDWLPAYDVWTGWGRASLAPHAGSLLQVSYTRQSADTMVYPYLQMDALSDTADRAGGSLEIAELPGGWSALSTSAYFTRVNHWMTDEYRTSAAGMPRAYSMATRAKTQVAGGRVEVHRGALVTGFEVSRRNWDSRTLLAARQYVPQAPLADATIDVAGVFASYSKEVEADRRLDAGVRLDRAVSDLDRSIANVAAYLAYYGTDRTRVIDVLPVGYARGTWQRGAWTITGGVGHAARLPDQLERYYALQRMGTDWVGNPGLRPARNTGVDGEVRLTRAGVDAALTVFAYSIANHVTVSDRARVLDVPGVMNRVTRAYANVDALVRGMELRATVPLARALFLSAEASAVRGTTSEGWRAGPNLPEMPPARGRIRLRFDNARWHATAEGVGATGQHHVVPALGESPTPAFAVANVRLGFRLRALEVVAAFDNLFDALYAEHLSYQRDPFRTGIRVFEPGRTLMLSVGAKF